MAAHTIVLAEHFTDSAFDRLLRATRRMPPRSSLVVFDLAGCRWIELFPLVMLAQLVGHLQDLDVQVVLQPPRSRVVQQFLSRYRFIDVVSACGAKIEGRSAGIDERLDNTPVVPLTQFDQPWLGQLLSSMHQPERTHAVLQQLAGHDVVRSGALRDVAVQELGDNVFRHADATRHLIALVHYRAVSTEDVGDWIGAKRATVAPLERRFFDSLRGAEHLALVISDNGRSIPATLRKAYLRDTYINHDEPVNDARVVEYSFMYHSSRRTLAERLEGLATNVALDSYPPPTGLSRLLRVAQSFHGLLSVRSRRARVVYDFLSSRGKAHSPSCQSTLPAIQGTHFKLVVPVARPQRHAMVFVSRRLAHPGVRHEYVGVSRHHASPQVILAALAERLSDATATASARRPVVLVVDGRTIKALPPKLATYAIVDVASRQSDCVACVIVEADDDLMLASSETAGLKAPLTLPLLLVDTQFALHCAPANHDVRQALNALLAADDDSVSMSQAGVGLLAQWTSASASEQARGTHLSQTAILDCAMAALSERARLTVTALPRDVFDPEVKVKMSHGYCEGFFSIPALVRDGTIGPDIPTWLKLQIRSLPSAVTVVSLGAYCRDLVTQALLSFNPPGLASRWIDRLRFRADVLATSAALPSGEPIVLFTDVVATADTVTALLKRFRGIGPISVLALVDARPTPLPLSVEGDTVPVTAFLRYPLTISRHWPAAWKAGTVCLLDDSTGILRQPASVLQADQVGILGARSVDHGWLMDALQGYPSAVTIGHLEGRKTHLAYHLDVSELLLNSQRHVIDAIVENLKADATESGLPVSHIFYPAFYRSLGVLCSELSAALGYVERRPMHLHEWHAHPRAESPSLGTAVIVDDCITTGDTVLAMLDAVARQGFRRVRVYVLARRGPSHQVRRLAGIRRFHEAHVWFTVIGDAQLPTFAPAECPLCSWNREVATLAAKLSETMVLSQEFASYSSSLEAVPPGFGGRRLPVATAGRMAMFRWLLEVGMESVDAQQRLLREAAGASDDDLLPLMAVLSHEARLLLIQKRVEQVMPDLVAPLVAAATRLMRAPQLRTTDECEAIATVLFALSAEHACEHFSEQISLLAQDRAKLVRVLAGVLKAPPATAHMFLAYLEAAPVDSDPTVAECLATARDILSLALSGPAHSGEQAAKAYRRIVGGTLHKFGHVQFAMLAALEESLSEGRKHWESFHAEFVRSQSLLRTFVDAMDSPVLVTRVRSLGARLDGAVAALEADLVGKDGEDDAKRARVREGLRFVGDAIDGPEGVLRILEAFQTNAAQVARKAVAQSEKELARKAISCEQKYPEEAVLVFAEEPVLLNALVEVLRNACRHSKAHNVRLALTIQGPSAVIAVSDDGQGLLPGTVAKVGLAGAEEALRRFGARVIVRPADTADRQGGWNPMTVVSVELPIVHRRNV